ncbi:MAG: peptide-methionine (S)-S-oxide reductase MsrA [Candidatus Micrarchaeota archaeon]|nr:peptide-methionine (S)-S-oxide reductase MsrA [Candidatus Micrarchaeota archaeon]
MTSGSIVFGGGCFWCTEAVFEMFKGVTKTTPGYAGGTRKDPTYEQVCEGTTGHAEVLEIQYDPKIITLEKLLNVFFRMHDPTSLNQQGADVGTQYRSIILYNTPEDKKVIDEFIKKQKANFEKPIVTEVRKLDRFYVAEDYHKKYFDKNPLQPYCIFVTKPKVEKIKKEFGIA